MNTLLSLLSPDQIVFLQDTYGTVENWFVSLGAVTAEAYETIIVDLIM